MPNLVQNPFPIFTDVDGDPLENGYVTIGIAGLNPISNPLQAYWDAALSVPANNIRTKGGYPSNNGTPGRLYTVSNYSILVQDKKLATVYSQLDSTDYFNSPAGNVIQKVNTIADLRDTVPGDTGTPMKVTSYYALGDVGDIPFYYWDATSSATDNGGSIIKPTAVTGNGRWLWSSVPTYNPLWFGAVGDGITDDSAIVNSVILLSDREMIVSADHYTPTLSNLAGIIVTGQGKLLINVVGGIARTNSENDLYKYVFGQEYLSHFHQKYIDGWSTQPAIVFSGDSTTEGASINPGYFIHELYGKTAESKGLNTAYGMALYNQGHSGDTTTEWLSTYLAQDLAIPNIDLYFIRWGINDGSTLTKDQFLANLRTGLTTLRASFATKDLSVCLMSPSTTYDTPNGRDADWYESIIPGMKTIAREFKCVFIDTYSFLRDSSIGSSALYMDNPFGDDRAVHPLDVMNMTISSLMTEATLPDNLKAKHGIAELVSLGGTFHAAAVNALPGTYVAGQTISRATIVNGWPLDGGIITTRSADGLVFQMNYPYLPADNKTYVYRFGNVATGVWSGFRQCGGASVFPTPGTGYSLQAPNWCSLKARRESALVCVEGYILKDVESVITIGDTIATFQSGYRPNGDDSITFMGAILDSGGVYNEIFLSMDSAGVIKCAKTTTGQAIRVNVNTTFSGLSYIL